MIFVANNSLLQTISNKEKSFKVVTGLTFIELLVVIAIIGILAGLAVPRLRTTFANLELEGFVKDLSYLARYLQSSAIAEGKIYYLSIDRANLEFRSAYKEDSGLKELSGRFGKIYKAPEGLTLSIEPPEKAGVYFYPDGSIEKVSLIFQNQLKKQISLVIKGAMGEIKIK